MHLDGTLGMGGHAEAVLERFGHARVVGIDRDPQAIELASERLARFGDRFVAHHGTYDEVGPALERLGVDSAQSMLFDLGVSSLQLDEVGRGFFAPPGVVHAVTRHALPPIVDRARPPRPRHIGTCPLEWEAQDDDGNFEMRECGGDAIRAERDDADLSFFGAAAKCFASDVAMKVTTDAVQLLGGAGYVKDFPVERMMRDAKITQIYEGTNEIQRLVISRTMA